MKNRMPFLLIFAMMVQTFCLGMQPSKEPKKVTFAAQWNVTQQETTGTGVKLVSKKGESGPKIIGIILASESYYFEDPKFSEYQAVQKTMELLATQFGQESIAARAVAPEAISSNSVLELITLDMRGDAKSEAARLAQFIKNIYKQNPAQKHVPIVIFAWGSRSDIVNQATHLLSESQAIDVLIYFQSPIYEWYWSLPYRAYYESKNANSKPINFKKLYHFYSKGFSPVPLSEIASYPDRKYRQQARVQNGTLIMPVKNCALYKNDAVGGITAFGPEDFYKTPFISNIGNLIAQIDRFLLNFDLLYIPQQILINRFVYLGPDNDLRIKYGNGTGQDYRVFPKLDTQVIPDAIYEELKHQFARELTLNEQALKAININQTDQFGMKIYLELEKRHSAAKNDASFKKR